MVSMSVLATKLFRPSPRPGAVLRHRLLARLSEGLARKLTLLAAPAGSGKTTLVSAWAAAADLPAAWLSLDPDDGDPVRFLSYVLAALQTVRPDLGGTIVAALQSPQPPPVETLLADLLNALAALPERLILVLDDYHVVDSDQVDRALAFLVAHLPPQLHLVIATREDPALPLAQLRARGQLSELRLADLCFAPDEAASFFAETMGLRLAEAEVAALVERTEGWAAGLQLAGLSLHSQGDPAGIIRSFAGSHRFVIDYLVEEVLDRQPLPLQRFLLHSAILDRLCGPLCDDVVADPAAPGQATLEALERANLFLIPLDDERRWFRYHHLFGEVLRQRLRRPNLQLEATGTPVVELHGRASRWYERNDLVHDAFRHALAAGEVGRAADLIEWAAPTLRRERQEHTLLRWLRALPDELIASRPVLCVQYAGVLLSVGELVGVEARLRAAERWLDTPTAELGVQDEARLHQLRAEIALYRAAHALALGNVAATVEYGAQTLDRASEDEQLLRGAAMGLLGLAHWTSGNLEGAYQSFADGLTHLQEAGNVADAIGGAVALVDIRATQGRLREARQICERGLRLAVEHGAPQLRGTADMYVGLSELAYERGDVRAALEHLARSQEQGEHTGFPRYPYRWRVARARISAAQGDLDGALDLLEEAERRYVGDFFPLVRPVATWKTRVWLTQGRLGNALAWARERGLSAHDELSYLREFEHLTLARVLLARSQSDPADPSLHEAIGLLDRLLQAAEAGARTGSLIEVLVLRARAFQLQEDLPAALASLSRALTLAEPEGFVRVFVDEGPAMAALIEAQSAERRAQSDPLQPYRERLLAVFHHARAEEARASATQVVSRSEVLVEPLSERERDVLRLLRTDLGGPEIARMLVVSLHTLRTHTKNIYAKLGVNGRRAAVRRAEELGLR